jgi:hypothetical protein
MAFDEDCQRIRPVAKKEIPRTYMKQSNSGSTTLQSGDGV